MSKVICGIQQMGIGVPNVQEIWKWYRKFFGVNVRVFEEAAEAPLMTRYTGDKVQAQTVQAHAMRERRNHFSGVIQKCGV